ncbi:uncharacterized protein LOC127812235 [Diospyros lotus]|uniref:uncharacterized protein LOC127812235 n=1 Tax=Diospyros lotus TaxID=55363 RepID=UPI00225A063A|nr:uncharacterized protein LOC127812235 [Diospyros lotus]
MAARAHCFVEWKEQFVSKERGNRVVHYFLKDISGESILAVVGTERSVRHMFYVVSEEFLNTVGAENSVQAGFRWRSRREVVNWLTSMLSKQHLQRDPSKSPKNDPMSGVTAQWTNMPDYKGHLAKNLKGHTSDIVWSGVAWKCGKLLNHYPAFCRNGIRIAVQSFVFVMAEEDNHYLAYLEDMYEDRKGQKKVKVRWFHHNQEVQGVVFLRNPHPKEVFITPYAQVISVECVDGPATVLTREHYQKCIEVIPSALLARIHLCHRQFKGNRVKPFKLSKLRGYFDQSIFSCLDRDFLEAEDGSAGDSAKVGAKRTRSSKGRQKLTYNLSDQNLKYEFLSRSRNRAEFQPWYTHPFKVNDKIELMCQDSGIRGCWFRCAVLDVSRRQIKVQYDDLKDEDGYGKLEEWVPAFRLARPDKLGMRRQSRPTIRPALHHNRIDHEFEVGFPVDAWWSDGWWEGVVTGTGSNDDESLQVYIPSENLHLNMNKENLRVSRDWTGDQWVDIKPNPDIHSALSSVIGPVTKLPASSFTMTHPPSHDCPISSHEIPPSTKLGLDDSTPSNELPCDAHLERIPVEGRDDDSNPASGGAAKANSEHPVEMCGGGGGESWRKLEEFETADRKSETELLEAVA